MYENYVLGTLECNLKRTNISRPQNNYVLCVIFHGRRKAVEVKRLTCPGDRVWRGEGKRGQKNEEHDVDEQVSKVDVASVCSPLVVQETRHKRVFQQVDLGRGNLICRV